MAARPPLKPEPPLAKRLNRNALTVAAVIMGMTVLTAVVVVRPSHEAHGKASVELGVDEGSRMASRPAFLDEPVRVGTVEPHTEAPLGLVGHAGGVGLETGAQSPAARGRWTAGGASSGPALAGVADTDRSSTTPEPLSGPRAPSARRQAYQAALTSRSILADAAAAAAAAAPASPAPPGSGGESGGPSLAGEEQRVLDLGDSVLRAAARASTGGAWGEAGAGERGRSAGSDEARTAHRGFLDRAGDAHGATVLARLDPAGSPYTLRAGTVIPGLLLTAINSDLPGDLVGQVSRDVYDSRVERTLLVPKGSRLIGTYDNQIAAGEGRLLVAWTRLILPDGRSMRLPGLALKDPQGQTGAKDQVDTHWQRVFGKALLLSAISAGVQLSQPRQTSVFAPPSPGQVAAGALGQELSNVALEVLRRGMDVLPTITIRQGQPFNVFLNGDLVFDGPYEEESRGDR